MLQFGAKSPIAIGSGSRSPSPTMTILLEITDLFARLASHSNDSLACHHNLIQEGEEALDRSISKLSQSLNLSDNSRVGVLDTVLSLMCFKAPEVGSFKLGLFGPPNFFFNKKVLTWYNLQCLNFFLLGF